MKNARHLLHQLFVTVPTGPGPSARIKGYSLNLATRLALNAMALQFNLRPSLRPWLRGVDGWINFSVGLKTASGSVAQAITFNNGRVRVSARIPEDVDVVLSFADDGALVEMFRQTPNEMLNLILKNRMILDGNLAYLQLFNFLISLLMGKAHRKMLKRATRADAKEREKAFGGGCPDPVRRTPSENRQRKKPAAVKSARHGANRIGDPALSHLGLEDFPRLKSFLEGHLNTVPRICTERPRLLTAWFQENGFERDRRGRPWAPELRQALAFRHLMTHKAPLIRDNDLLAGTTTAEETCGVILYPDAQGVMIWGELKSIGDRILNPYRISEESIRTLHREVFPFWARRNFREWVRTENDYPVCQRLDERWVAYFVWKSVGISHTIPDFPRLLDRGTLGLMEDIAHRLAVGDDLNAQQGRSLAAMKICLEGVNGYAANLSRAASRMAAATADTGRRAELENLSAICARVPMHPPETLHEAFQALWIAWVGLHNENSNTGLSLGRLDQWLQPYFQRDLEKIEGKGARQAYIRRAVELAGCFFLRCTDHLPATPDIGNYLFGGASSTQALTLGGVTRDGADGVCDMTYVFLKATEMLAPRDVNVNARFHPEKNTDAYLQRLCQVNLATAATPSLHNDKAVFASLAPHAYPEEDIRDWSATGCVEPTLSGRHMGHTGSILMNLVAAMEMALNNGRHPLMNWQVGPATGQIETNDFKDFESFLQAYFVQLDFLIAQAVAFNNLLADVHARYRPTPLLSVLIEGAVATGTDVTRGGARYNTSGTSNIGLADVTDSLLVIQQLVFDEQKISLGRLKRAVDSDFADDPALHAMVRKQVRLFGSGDERALAMARQIIARVHALWERHKNFRDGKYTAGFWSMSQHVAYGSLSGALPSGRRRGKAFTPGLTPNPDASNSFLDNIRDVARLDPGGMQNNIAFNVKLVPAAGEAPDRTVDAMTAYARTYFDLGGMQMQFNVVSSETLRDAMAHPEQYRNLLVRISGYNAYFVTLNREIQLELIERAEYGL
jgi:pyruvate formate-lyase/glycerol dehydratase family glycyl radical enzyme